MWHEQAIMEWSWHVISVVACCHNVKLCTLAARAFRSQQNGTVTRMWRSCQVHTSQKECVVGAIHCKKKDVVATSPLALPGMCDSPRMGCARRTTLMWHEQAIIEWSSHVISIVACCHSMKLCALAAQAFWSQQYWYILRQSRAGFKQQKSLFQIWVISNKLLSNLSNSRKSGKSTFRSKTVSA